MGGYEKQIVYFDLIENGERVGNAGFSKVIVQNGQLRLTVHIRGLHKTDTIRGELLFLQNKGEIFVDNLQLQEGKCVYSRLFDSEMLHKLQIQPEQLYGICVKVGENRMLRALWRQEPSGQEAPMQEVPIQEAPIQEVPIQETPMQEVPTEKAPMQKVTEPIQYDSSIEGKEPAESIAEAVEDTARKEQREELQIAESQTAQMQIGMSYGKETQVFEDKWKQLEQTYPVIHPFRDDREYLSISPKDFIVLTREYQSLAVNSFLLHGFYNYHHLILGKVSKKGDELFFIGVPGVFYEREKAVALMFGFESFECEKEPAQIGEMGYYMKRVDI